MILGTSVAASKGAVELNLQSRLQQSSVAGGDGVDDLLVHGPDDGPVKVDDILGGALGQNELFQSLDGHSAPANSTNSREAGVIPATDNSLIYKPGQLPLTEKGLDEVEPGEIPDMDLPQVQSIQEPPVLWVAVTVLDSSERMCHALELIDQRAGEVVCRVDLVLVSGTVVSFGVAAVDDRVTHGLVGIVDGHFGTKAVLDTLKFPLRQYAGFVYRRKDIIPLPKPWPSPRTPAGSPQCFGPCSCWQYRPFSPYASGGVSRCTCTVIGDPDLFLDGVVTVRLAQLDQFDSLLVEPVKRITSVGDDISLDSQELKVLQDAVLELLLLLRGVGIIEPNDQFALVVLSKVLVEHGRFGVTNVKVSRRLRRESCHNTLIGIQQSNLKVRLLALGLLLG